METGNVAADIINRYLEMELLMASLYDRYAKFYTSHKEFWSSLISEEHEHAAWVKHFQEGISLDKIHFSEGKVRIAALESSIAYVKNIIGEFDRHHCDQTKAVGICLDLEKSLIERNVFRRFDSDSPEIRKMLDILNESQELHVRKIEHFLGEMHKK